MMRDPSTLLATVYTVGVLIIALDDESGHLVSVRPITPIGGNAFTLYRAAYITQCVLEAQRRHRLTLEG